MSDIASATSQVLGGDTPASAAEQLETFLADPANKAAYLAGNGPHGAQVRKLISAKLAEEAAASKLDKIIAGAEVEIPAFETVTEGLSTYNQILAASWMRDLGIEPAAIKEAFTGGGPIPRTLHDEARKLKEDKLSDAEFTSKYLKGDREAKRTMLLLNILLTRDVEAT